ncbi:cytochrome b/b6 domain-containing protein [Thiococcus pfennigii]|jgi:thiosulfate reductase cytochrome b subunit|uniref:cytochrome b/b6 domain-containing protein n=1 Tax=Thiococcus pfennigii TaxID=1057 RepID=UPI001904F750|nr:cytochrome b/b6 domain-containing protein [Thiococcus pfennigii]MBK1700518.1 cytochrome B [Thiococcus pfennigii]MBK1733018.1 cytochrome B [Thiococcus pfennigii]
MATREVLIFGRFERFWHWGQMVLIVLLMFTGFGLHGFHNLLDFRVAVTLHTFSAFALLILWLFSVFWLFTTETWRHFLPTGRGLWRVLRFYSYGIFKGERHPYRKAYWRKHNPLQALAYLMLKIVLFPLIWITGIAYLLYFLWRGFPFSSEILEWIALIHTGAAFAILVFALIHIYMLTTGHSFWEHVRPMVTGFDKVELTPEEEAYLEKDQPAMIR